MPYIGKAPADIIATAVDTTTGTFSGVVDADAGITVDNITIDGTEIDLSSGDLTVDVAGSIILDADSGSVNLADAGTTYGELINSSSDFVIKSSVSDKDLIFKGNDGGSLITALTLDMSAAGDATFNQDIYVRNIYGASDGNTGIQWEGSDVLTFHTGGAENIQLTSNAIVFNQDSADMDLRIESNNNTAMFFVDAGNDRIGVGTDSPSHLLDVDGGSAVARLRVSSTGTGAREAGIILANSSKSSDNDGIVISHGSAATTFDDLGGNELMRLGQSSNRPRLALGTSSPDGLLTISGDENPLIRVNHTQNADEIMMIMQHAGAIASGFTTMIAFRDHDGDERGTIKTNGSSTQFNTSSDYRLKENVTYDFDATSRLKQLKPARFNFIGIADTTVDGFLAHEVSSIVPEAISGEKDATEDLGTIKDIDGNVIEENVVETRKGEGQTWTKTKTKD